jgi:hypothetical protein
VYGVCIPLTKILQFIQPAHLDIKPAICNEVVWQIAGDELRRMNYWTAPGDKINCVLKCSSVIFSVLNLARSSDDTSRPGADDFLPIFIYVVLRAKVDDLHRNCEYIKKYRNKADLNSKAGYSFVSLCSAIEFILHCEADMMSIDQDEFERKVAEGNVICDAEDAAAVSVVGAEGGGAAGGEDAQRGGSSAATEDAQDATSSLQDEGGGTDLGGGASEAGDGARAAPLQAT